MEETKGLKTAEWPVGNQEMVGLGAMTSSYVFQCSSIFKNYLPLII